MGLKSGDRTFHEGEIIPDDWVPVVVGTDLPSSTVCLRIGTGGASMTTQLHRQVDAALPNRTFLNLVAGERIPGRFKQVTAVTGVADIMAGVLY